MLAANGLAQPASNDSVYRCGPDGRSYSAAPCPEGRAVKVADPRDANQRREAEEIAQRERQLADRLAAERTRREAAIVPAGATSLGPRPAGQAASGAKHAKSGTKKNKKGNKKGKSTDPRLTDPMRSIPPSKP
ncbi:MAG: hypothetical protein HY855_22500 [Burkholderiales bacterium]|nr:hypothetical protein [Burkholderiales bacterium]